MPFLDVMVSRDQSGSPLTKIYRKPTWSGLYTHFFSFVPLSYKKSLVRTLFHRARRLCSPIFLDDEFSFLTRSLLANGYPKDFIFKYSQSPSQHLPVFGPEPKPVFIKIPYLGESFSKVVLRRISNVRHVLPCVKPVVLFSTCRVPVRSVKDFVPQLDQSHLIYQFTCDCGYSYVGRTERTLRERTKEHLPRWLATSDRRPRSSAPPASNITRHVMSCTHYRPRSDSSNFTVLFRSSVSSHLRVLEALSILQLKPPLSLKQRFCLNSLSSLAIDSLSFFFFCFCPSLDLSTPVSLPQYPCRTIVKICIQDPLPVNFHSGVTPDESRRNISSVLCNCYLYFTETPSS